MAAYIEESECYKCGRVYPTYYQAMSCCKSQASSTVFVCLNCHTKHSTVLGAQMCCTKSKPEYNPCGKNKPVIP